MPLNWSYPAPTDPKHTGDWKHQRVRVALLGVDACKPGRVGELLSEDDADTAARDIAGLVRRDAALATDVPGTRGAWCLSSMSLQNWWYWSRESVLP